MGIHCWFSIHESLLNDKDSAASSGLRSTTCGHDHTPEPGPCTNHSAPAHFMALIAFIAFAFTLTTFMDFIAFIAFADTLTTFMAFIAFIAFAFTLTTFMAFIAFIAFAFTLTAFIAFIAR